MASPPPVPPRLRRQRAISPYFVPPPAEETGVSGGATVCPGGIAPGSPPPGTPTPTDTAVMAPPLSLGCHPGIAAAL